METVTAELDDLQTTHELPYEDLLIASQTEEHRSKQLHAALCRLTKRQKEIIKLRFYEGLSISQLAQSRALTQEIFNRVIRVAYNYRIAKPECVLLSVADLHSLPRNFKKNNPMLIFTIRSDHPASRTIGKNNRSGRRRKKGLEKGIEESVKTEIELQ